jgi:hypothetical protein
MQKLAAISRSYTMEGTVTAYARSYEMEGMVTCLRRSYAMEDTVAAYAAPTLSSPTKKRAALRPAFLLDPLLTLEA